MNIIYRYFAVREETKELCNSMLKNHKDWKQDEYVFWNKSLSIWTGNGVFFIDLYPSCSAFNIVEKFYIKSVIRKVRFLNINNQ